MAVVMAGLQVLGNVGKCAEILGVLGSTGDVPDLVLSNDILPGSTTSTRHPSGDGKYTWQTVAVEGVLGTGKGSFPARSAPAPSRGRNKWQHGPQAASLPNLWHSGDHHHLGILPQPLKLPRTSSGFWNHKK